jgi:hypothetical protein
VCRPDKYNFGRARRPLSSEPGRDPDWILTLAADTQGIVFDLLLASTWIFVFGFKVTLEVFAVLAPIGWKVWFLTFLL